MIQFSRLRLHGFKSFVERTEVEISPGLNGIVGPNGCGKSNLVEALRWSMGESSSKRMRGGSGSMDDVIFSGTAQRPARNVAEVSVLLDNTKRTAPEPYNGTDEIEVVRRIERDQGSSYRINGKPVRARDVQLLYADLLSGANSPFLVSQGKITEMIQAKPSDRRRYLEDAAGISGLYARRHEAELRLRATDNNLNRLEDLLGSMDTRLRELKKQARQANRYRNLSEQIRALEVKISSLEWRRAKAKLNEVETTFGTAESAVAERMIVVNQLTRTQNTQAQDLPDLRKAEAEASAALQTKKLALQRLEDEGARLSQELEQAEAQLEQLAKDRTHERETLTENSGVLERLEAEEKRLLANRDNEESTLKEHEATKEKLQAHTDELEESYRALMERTATDNARKQSLEQQIAQDTQRKEAIAARLKQADEQLQQYSSTGEDTALATTRQAVADLERDVETLRQEIGELESSIETLRQEREATRDKLNNSEQQKTKISSEVNSLSAIVKTYSQEGFKAVFDDIQTEDGFELALSRALGDTLMASTEQDAPVVWAGRSMAEIETSPLPASAKPLKGFVKAPSALDLALGQIGLVESKEEGDRLAKDLKAGQALVSPEGDYWRWDGLRIHTEASDRHAIQLKQKNRLAELEKKLPALIKAVEDHQALMAQHETTYQDARDNLKQVKDKLLTAERNLKGQRTALEQAVAAQSARETAKAKLEETLTLARSDIQMVEEKLAENTEALAAFDEATLTARQEEASAAKETLADARQELHAAISDYELCRQENSRRQARLQAIGDERINLQNRCIRARERLKELDERESGLKERATELEKRPTAIKKESEALLSIITEREAEKSAISDKLAVCENELADTTKALKEAEHLLAQSREARAHAQATAAERQRQIEEIRLYIEEQFGITPEELGAQAAFDSENLPALDALKQEKDQAVRSRDLIGPVNLRAEQEADELEKELGGILEERNDLMAAIDELRQGIQKLNREARERLQTAFALVNGHFRTMFSQLFNGGKAHLALIESDDPLEAGLEIYAQPPGKTLQSLTLLSGGEQTLTAIALIFAMFLTNPAPICVLDEVDAPLDDANVDRFCDLLEEFAERGETRFVLITHHRLTMARMDRLYGVTMAEKGISQLVSVDLNQQFDFLEAAE